MTFWPVIYFQSLVLEKWYVGRSAIKKNSSLIKDALEFSSPFSEPVAPPAVRGVPYRVRIRPDARVTALTRWRRARQRNEDDNTFLLVATSGSALVLVDYNRVVAECKATESVLAKERWWIAVQMFPVLYCVLLGKSFSARITAKQLCWQFSLPASALASFQT